MYYFQVCIKKCSISLYYSRLVSRVLLMSALILYCATSMFHVLHRHAPDLIDMVVPVTHLTGRCHLHSFVLWKLILSHPNNYRHPFFQPNRKSIMVMPMNVKKFDNFLQRSVGHFSSKFCPKLWISRFCSFFVQKEFLVSLLMVNVDTIVANTLGPKVAGQLELLCIQQMNRMNSHKSCAMMIAPQTLSRLLLHIILLCCYVITCCFVLILRQCKLHNDRVPASHQYLLLTGALCSRVLLRTGFRDSLILSPDFGSFDFDVSNSSSSSDWSAAASGNINTESSFTSAAATSWPLFSFPSSSSSSSHSATVSYNNFLRLQLQLTYNYHTIILFIK